MKSERDQTSFNMHSWGDGFPYFREVGEAADFIGDFCIKYGRIPVRQTKEKFGTVRVYSGWGIYNLYWFFRPHYVYYRWPRYIRDLDDAVFARLFRFFNKPIYTYQSYIYRLAYKKTIEKYPMIKKEILCSADWPELLVGL